MSSREIEITALLHEWRRGDPTALERLTPAIYSELRRLAARQMRLERTGHSLQPTALVHEAYLRLGSATADWQDRAHFFAIAASIMRQILVDHARSKRRLKRGGGAHAVEMPEIADGREGNIVDLLAIDAALRDLGQVDARKVRVVELRFFAGLSVEETAMVLEVSPNTVIRDWAVAKAWLGKRLGSETHEQ